MLGVVVLLGSLYALYLLYLGLPRLMKCPADKTPGYLGSVLVSAIVIGLVGSLVIGRIGRRSKRRRCRRSSTRRCIPNVEHHMYPARMRETLCLLLLFLTLVPGARAWAQPSMAGYVVDGAPTQTVQTAPAGWVGRKTIDSQRRVSNADETRGTEAIYSLTFGGFVRGCPTADGVVDGTFEYALTSEVRTVPGQTLHSRYSRQLVAQLRGEVGPDARLIQIELFGSWSIETRQSGMPPSLQTQPVRQTFRPGSSGEPDWHAMEGAVRSTADLSVAAVIMWAGEFYKAAEANWNKLNECVEFAFDPPSDQLSLAPNESAPVRVELHTKAGTLPVPWETSSVQRDQRRHGVAAAGPGAGRHCHTHVHGVIAATQGPRLRTRHHLARRQRRRPVADQRQRWPLVGHDHRDRDVDFHIFGRELRHGRSHDGGNGNRASHRDCD